MADKGGAFGVALLAGCVLSLAGVPPLRWLEQGLAPLLQPLEGLLAPWAPAPDAESLLVLREPAQRAFGAWREEVLGPVPAAAAGREALLVPVVGRRAARHELLLAVPAGAVARDAPVTHRGALLGFVTELSADGLLATVALLGKPDARPVAAEWCVVPEARPVSFLLTGSGNDDDWTLRVEAPSSSVRPPSDQLAWTRDVSALGDDLPAGLLVGRLQLPAERPGGGLPRASASALTLLPLIDPLAVDLVTVEGQRGAARESRRAEARLLATCRVGRTLRLDGGERAGVHRGDWVLQDGLFVGVVSESAAWSAVVDGEALPTSVLVVSPAGDVVACGPRPERWPAGWHPQPGDLVVAVHLAAGGLVVGTVDEVDDDDGFTIERLQPGAGERVEVLGP